MTPLPNLTTDRETARHFPKGTEPRVLPKWTRLNDEWVEVYCQIIRNGSGYIETPAKMETIK